MKGRKLSPKQKEVYALLSQNPGGFLRQHIKPTGLVCWRVLDEKLNPLLNVSENVVYNLIEKDVLERSGQNYILKATIAQIA